MDSKRLLSFAAIAVAMLLLLQLAAAATLRDVFGAFASLGKEKPEYDFDGSGGKITFGDIITAMLGVFGLGGGSVACSKVADCPITTQGSLYCDSNQNLVYNVAEYTCLNPGTPSSRCHASTKTVLQQACPNGCANGNCLAPLSCTPAIYGPVLETHETSCTDFYDSDCDGKFDCDDEDCFSTSDCEIRCTTNDSRFPVKGGIKLAEYHESQQTGNCLSSLLYGRKIFLKNLSGQILNISNASVSIGTAQHFDKYLQMGNCATMGEFSSPECPDVDGLGGYREGFLIPTINGIAGTGEECALQQVAVPDSGEIQIETSEFYLCPIREYDCPYATDEMWRAHKSNPITITLNTNIGGITVYCYNFPIPGSAQSQCTGSEQRNCSLQQGICAGAKETCSNGAWPGCTAANYGALYETSETSCSDLQDNDCDGKFDCDDSDCTGKDACQIYATTNDARFPVKGGITTAYMEIKGCIEIIDHLQSITTQPVLRFSPQADNNCVNWGLDGNVIYLKNLSGETVTVKNASISLGTSRFDDYNMSACAFQGHFSSEKCPDSNAGGHGGFSESFDVTSINGVLGSTQDCNINTSILAGQEIRVGVSDFSYCASRLPPECECSTDEMLRAHKDNPITITLNTSIGKIDIYLYNFPTDSPINNQPA